MILAHLINTYIRLLMVYSFFNIVHQNLICWNARKDLSLFLLLLILLLKQVSVYSPGWPWTCRSASASQVLWCCTPSCQASETLWTKNHQLPFSFVLPRDVLTANTFIALSGFSFGLLSFSWPFLYLHKDFSLLMYSTAKNKKKYANKPLLVYFLLPIRRLIFFF